MRVLVVIVAALTALMLQLAPNAPGASGSLREYTHRLAIARWHSEIEWRSLNEIVWEESSWNPCSVYPSRRDCAYAGGNSCGLPQRSPCPSSWRGRLWETRFAQARWLVDYIAGRYGSPSRALSFRRANGWY